MPVLWFRVLAASALLLLSACSGPTKPVEPEILYGDINLDGVAFNAVDVVSFINHFRGKTQFSEDPEKRARFIAASDVNRDGVPLTVSDLDLVGRIVFRGPPPTSPLPRDRDTLTFTLVDSREKIELYAECTTTLSAIWLKLAHPGQDAVCPVWVTLPEDDDDCSGISEGGLTRFLLRRDSIPLPTAERGPALIVPHDENVVITVLEAQASTPPGRSVTVLVTESQPPLLGEAND